MLRLPNILHIVFVVAALLVAITVHEASHALVAYRLGDPTAKNLGRLSLNPIVHLDPLGTMMMLVTAVTGFGIGWGRPVPVDPANLRGNVRVSMAQVSFAGPAANLVTAGLMAIPLRLSWPIEQSLEEFIFFVILVNIAIALFNLIPLHPLDGFKVLLGLLPGGIAYRLARYGQYGPPILLTIIFLEQWLKVGILGSVLVPATAFLLGVLLR